MDHKMLEELSLNNWPSLSTLFYDGWVLRFSDGYTKRSNSISPIHYSTCNLEQKISECEQIYALNHLPAIYKITPFVHPIKLDQILEDKGYSLIDLSSIQTLNLDHIQKPPLDSVKIETHIDNEWLNDFCRINRVEHANRPAMEGILSNIKTKKGFISLYDEGKVVACGLGVIERAYIGLYDIVTDIEYRNRGFGEQLLLNLLTWGRENGAKYSYLAVVMNNKPALKLYSKLGYTEAYKYWYRVKNAASS